jgi:lipoyl(octanoyl) transferase
MKLRYIDSPALSGSFNMACDYYLAENTGFDDSPILRLYTWLRPTISLGFHQKSTDIDFAACEKDGVDIVRRPTGGRAILHWGEITYCIVVPVEENSGKQALQDIYSKVHLGILRALKKAGSPVVFAGADKKPQPHNPLCFASSAITELELDGKKVVGSAQRLIGSTVLQHGSILLNPSHLEMPKYLNLPSDKKEELRKQLESKSTHLNIQDDASIRDNFAESISAAFGSEMYHDKLSDFEIAKIDSNKYAFTVSKTLAAPSKI